MSVRVWLSGALCLVSVNACMPSKAVLSAGQVGCDPSMIDISDDEYHPGLLQSAETWTAECNGRTFVCTQLDRPVGDPDSSTAQQVSCAAEGESPQEERNREAAEDARYAAVVRKQPSSAPHGVAGFDLGLSAADAQSRCEAAGKQWNASIPELPSCSAPAVDLGIVANVSFRFCAGRACSITVEHVPTRGWSPGVRRIKAQLEAKYGPAQSSNPPIPEQCRTEPGFTRCLQSGSLTLRYDWTWPAGEAIEMSVGKPSKDTASSIRLVYSRPSEGAANASAL